MGVLTNWRTTALGVAAAIAAISGALVSTLDGDPNTVANWSEVVAIVSAAVGLLFARDGVKPE